MSSQSTYQTAYRSVDLYLQGSRLRPTRHTQTDRPRYMCNNRLHLKLCNNMHCDKPNNTLSYLHWLYQLFSPNIWLSSVAHKGWLFLRHIPSHQEPCSWLAAASDVGWFFLLHCAPETTPTKTQFSCCLHCNSSCSLCAGTSALALGKVNLMSKSCKQDCFQFILFNFGEITNNIIVKTMWIPARQRREEIRLDLMLYA